MLDRTLDRLPSATASGVQPPRPRRGIVRRAFRVTLVVLLFLLVLLVGAVLAVLNGPVEVAFLRAQVADAIENALGDGYAATIASTAIGTDRVLGLVLRVTDLTITDSDGVVVARVPSTLLEVDPLAVFRPQAVIRSVEIDGLWTSMVRNGGRVYLGVLTTPPPPLAVPAPSPATATQPAIEAPLGPAPTSISIVADDGALDPSGFEALTGPVEAIDRSLDEVLNIAIGAGFRRLAAYGATIEVSEAGSPDIQRFERTDLIVTVAPQSRQLNAELSTSGYFGRWTVTADRAANATTGGSTLSLEFSQLTLADLLPVFSGGDALLNTDIPLYGHASARLNDRGVLENLTARLDLGAGIVSLGGQAAPVLLDEGSIRLAWNADNGILQVEPSTFYFGSGRATVTGAVAPGPGSGDRDFTYDLESRGAVIAPRDSNAPPLVVDRLHLAGLVDLDNAVITIDDLSVVTPSGAITLDGDIGLEEEGPSIKVNAVISPMPASVFKQLWPPGLVDGGRQWFLDNITAGRVLGGRIDADIPSGVLSAGSRADLTRNMLYVELQLADVTFKTGEGLPLVEHANGLVTVAGREFGVSIESGQATAPSGTTLQLTAGLFAIPDVLAPAALGQLEIQATGTTQGFAELANLPPMRALDGYGIKPTDLHGSSDASFSAAWLLIEGSSLDTSDWRVGVQMHDLDADVPLEGHSVEDGEVRLVVTPSLMSVVGVAVVDGLPADVDLSIPLLGTGDPGRQQIRVVLDEAARERLGFSLEGFLGGTVMAQLTDLGNGRQHYDLDLRQARVALGPLGWTKGIGVPATMSFDLVPTANGQRIVNLTLAGEGYGLTGEAEFDNQEGIISARVEDFRLRRDDNVDFNLRKEGDGWVIDVTGEALDIRGLIAEINQSVEGAGAASDLTVNARIGRLIGFNGEEITNAVLTVISRNGGISRIELYGRLAGQPIAASYVDPETGNAALDVEVNDAGALLRFVNFYTKVQGGQLRVTGREVNGAPMSGRFQLLDFTVVDEPALERLTGSRGSADATASAPFDHLVFDYDLRGSNIVVDDALLRGGDMGATMSGHLDMSAGSMSITGTYIPAYQVNSFFGRIPIIGLALGGGDQTGLFGVTFRISGPLDQVLLEINPLSVIAPGILRKIFEFQP